MFPEQFSAAVQHSTLDGVRLLPSANPIVVAELRDAPQETKKNDPENDLNIMILRELAQLKESFADLKKDNLEIRAIAEKNAPKRTTFPGGCAASDVMIDIQPDPILP